MGYVLTLSDDQIAVGSAVGVIAAAEDAAVLFANGQGPYPTFDPSEFKLAQLEEGRYDVWDVEAIFEQVVLDVLTFWPVGQLGRSNAELGYSASR